MIIHCLLLCLNLIFSIWPAVIRQATYGTIKFGTYYSLKKFLAKRRADGGAREHIPTNTACAAFAGGLSSAIANPTDVIKVRMQVSFLFRCVEVCCCDGMCVKVCMCIVRRREA